MLRFPGLAGVGLGDFAEWGVDSGLAEVPFTKKKKREKSELAFSKMTKFVNEAEQM